MTLNRVFKNFTDQYWKFYTYPGIYWKSGVALNKKKSRKIARKRMKQDKFYNGFYEFIESNRKKNEK